MKLVLAASPTAGEVLLPAFKEHGVDCTMLEWRAGSRPQQLPLEEPDAVVVSSLMLDIPSPQAADELVEFPRHLVDLARTARAGKVIYMVPEARGWEGPSALSFRSSVVMMKQSAEAVILRTGLLVGTRGIWAGIRLPLGLIVPGQGHGIVAPVLPGDIAAAVNAVVEKGKEGELGAASFDATAALGDFLSLLNGRTLRFHCPISFWYLRLRFGGWSIEAETLASYGKVAPSRNDLEELTGQSPRPLSSLTDRKAPSWIQTTASS